MYRVKSEELVGWVLNPPFILYVIPAQAGIHDGWQRLMYSSGDGISLVGWGLTIKGIL